MSKAHCFQRYSQKENVATNNTLLLLSRVYEHNPAYLEKGLTDLLRDTGVSVGLSFANQMRARESVPDAVIEQKGFKIIIEAKRGNDFDLKQLVGHLTIADRRQHTILLAIGNREIPAWLRKRVEAHIASEYKDYNISFCSTTYTLLVKRFRAIPKEWEEGITDIINDYEEYCRHGKLLVDDTMVLMTVPAGASKIVNERYRIHYDRCSSHQYFTHIGFYSEKAIFGIGKVRNAVTCDYDGSKLLIKTNGGRLQMRSGKESSIQ